MSETQSAPKLTWYWNKRAIPLYKLEDNQLYSIKDSINKSKTKVWFGFKKDIWLTAIDSLTKERQKFNIVKINNEISQRRIKRAEQTADTIMYGIVKAFSKNHYN